MTNPINTLAEQQGKQLLIKTLNAVCEVSEDGLNKLVDAFEFVSFKKNYTIIETGTISDCFYFICKGLIKVCYNKNDKTVIERFEKEGGYFGGNFSHLTKKPSYNFYESAEDIYLLRMKYTDLEKLCSESHELERLYRIVIGVFHSNYAERQTTFKSTTTDERYHEFVEQNNDIANRVSLKDLANYLDMTSETISRIRGKSEKYSKNK